MSDLRVAIPILDLGCGGGGSVLLERALSKVPGVSCAYVNAAREVAHVDFDPALVSIESLVSKIRVAGFRSGIPKMGRVEYERSEPVRFARGDSELSEENAPAVPGGASGEP